MPKLCPICDRSYSDDNAFCPVDGTTLRADVTGDLIGSVIADRYLITDLLGEGGMGRVYLGRHVRLPQQAAIKVLRQDLVQDTASIARFNREATSASRIQSEYVARVFDFGETQDRTVYLAMEYVPGRTLRSLVQAEGPLTLPRTATIISQIAEGLDAAHKLGIVHRDLKPDNIIIMDDDDIGDRAKVVDFGIAKGIGGGSEKEGQITSTGFVVGTPDYMSPEQLLNDNVDTRSDVYALGLVAYNMLTSTLPFDSTTPSKGMMARLVDAPAPLSQSNPRGMWSMQVQQVFDTVLSRDVDKRYATAREFAHALRECAGLAAPTIGAAMTATAMNAGVGTAASATGLRSAPAAAEARAATGAAAVGGKSRMLIIAGAVTGVAAIALAAVLLGGNDAGDGGTVSPVDAVTSAEAPRSTDTMSTAARLGGDSALTSSTSLVDASRGSPTTPPVAPTNSGGTTPPTRGNEPAGGSPTVPAVPVAAGASITASIDSVRAAVDGLFALDDAAIPAAARTQIQRIDGLLRRAPAAGDSARLYLLSANASKTAGDDKAACAALNKAKTVARSDVDKRAVDRNYVPWGCDSQWRQP